MGALDDCLQSTLDLFGNKIEYNLIFNGEYQFDKDSIDRVIFNDPATVVFWKDGTKTVVRCGNGDTYNPETGLAMCIIKKCCGNKGNYNDVFKKWLPVEVTANEK